MPMASRHGPKASEEPVLGRDRELRVLEAALDETSRGASPRVTVVGEPGIGKTALLRETRRIAAARGFRIAAGSASEFERDIPFGLAAEALDEVVAECGDRVREHLGPERLTELDAVFPTLAGGARRNVARLPAERYLIHTAVRRVIEALAAEQPVLLALDDVHWADEASLELVEHLIRRRPRAGVALLIAYRPSQAPRRLISGLATAAHDESVTEISLGPLDEHASGELLGARLDRAQRRAVYDEGGGNPFYMIELARARETGASKDGGSLPRLVAATIDGELERLAPAALTLLRAAAVAGDPFDLDLATAIAELAEDDGFAALDELLELDLVRAGDAPRSFRFRHPIVRRAVYESGPSARLLDAHRRAAVVLEQQGASLSARAHHVERFAEVGNEEAIALLEAAGREESTRSPAAAARWFAASLRLLAGGEPQRRLGTLVSLASALAGVGRIDETRTALMEALALVPAEHGLARARIVGLAAGAEHMGNDPGAARSLLARSLAELGDEPSEAGCALRLELALDRWFVAEWNEMAHLSREALAEARPLGNAILEAEAGALLALAEYYRARPEASGAAYEQVMRLLDDLSPAELAGALRAVLFIGQAGFGLERYAEAAEALRRGLNVSRESGQEFWFVPMLVALAVAELWQGHLSSALASAEEAIDASTLLDSAQVMMSSLSVRCWLLTLTGDLDDAIASGKLACQALERSPAALIGWLAHCCLGAALIEAAEPDRGRAAILRGGGGEALPAIEPSFRSHWLEVLSHAELALGRFDQAERWLGDAEALVERFPLPGRVAELRRGRAALLLARGDHGLARAEAELAAKRFVRQGQPIDAARATILAGRALAAAGERDAATSALIQARDALAKCGAEGYRAEAERALTGLGVGPADGSLAGLTDREHEVAELVRAGLGNREIAAALVVSRRTVDRHLSRIFAKLGIGSRAALAAAVERSRAGSQT